jgi:hypothetical protein
LLELEQELEQELKLELLLPPRLPAPLLPQQISSPWALDASGLQSA